MNTKAERELLTRGYDLVIRLASGEERWTMCVPARPGKDSDLVLVDAIRAGEALADRVDELEGRLTESYEQGAADVARIAELEAALDEAQLRSIEARNPGIDMVDVRRLRAGR